jgi:hypothetical protein
LPNASRRCRNRRTKRSFDRARPGAWPVRRCWYRASDHHPIVARQHTGDPIVIALSQRLGHAAPTRYLNAKGIRIFDYPQFAMELRDRVRDCAASLAAEAGVTIEHIAKSHIRKEAVVARVLEQRGDRPGLVHIISAMEACDSYRPWHDKGTGRTFVRPDSGKCLHYYFYFMDVAFGLIYLRVPTPGSSPGAGCGARSVCNSTAHALGPSSRGTATAGWRTN